LHSLSAVLLAVVVMVCAAPSNARSEVLKTLIEWNFDSPEDAAAWTVTSNIADLAVKDGCLTGRAAGSDPSFMCPLLEIPASAYQFVEIRMKCTRSGYGELFWTNTTEQPYNGFRGSMMHRIDYGAGDFQVYRIFPFWQDLGRVIRLRIDPPEGSEFAVDYVKVVEISVSHSDKAFFDFLKGDPHWVFVGDAQPREFPGFLIAEGPGEAVFLSPKVNIEAGAFPWLSASINLSGLAEGDHAVFQWVSDELSGVRSYTLPLKPGRHVYNIPTDQIADWIGNINMLAVRAPLTRKGIWIESIGAAAKPMGPAELDIRRAGFREAVNRINKTVVIEAQFANIGGEPATDITASLGSFLSLPKVPIIVGKENRVRGLRPWIIGERTLRVDELKPGESRLLTWEACSEAPGLWSTYVKLDAAGKRIITKKVTLRWDPAVSVQPAGYVPEPKPVRGDYEVGMYYFPGWHTYSRWSVLDEFPERRPILGYYREGDPQVADWHIKWMVEHGVTFIVYDWYWSAGARQLDHALHQGFFNAKYRDKIRFCLLWANHNAPGTSSAEDMVNVTNYWLDNYFLRPEYFKIDGKPVVVVFSPHRLTDDMGIEGVRQAFDKSREMARARGLAGVYFVGCAGPSRGQLEVLEKEGYDAATGYNYPSAGDKGQMVAPYDDMVTGYQEIWNTIADNTSLRYIPVTEPGWDSRPWHGPNARARTGKTPEKFKKMLENAREFVEQLNPDVRPKIVLIEAWNEFGEGDYVEPHQEFGFAHVDAIREVFTSASADHQDIVPQDVGLGPYELPKPEPVTAWEFEVPGSPGWDVSQNLAEGKVENGCLTAVSTGPDPAFYSETVDLDSRKLGLVEIRMKVDKGAGAQLFWAGKARPFSEAASIRFDLIADGEFHVYRLDLSGAPAWKSGITALRLDPTDAKGARIALDYVRFAADK